MKLSELLTALAGVAIAALTTTSSGYIFAGTLIGGALTSAAKRALDRAYWDLDKGEFSKRKADR